MRLIHTADWHLGSELHGYDRSFEHTEFLEWLLATVKAVNADVLLVAGDIYHSVNPSVRAQKLLFRTLFRLRERCPKLQTVLIGGNHDSPSRLELPADLLHGDHLKIIGAMGDPGESLSPLYDADGRVAAVCGAVPYLRPGDLPAPARAIDGDGDSDETEPTRHPIAELYEQVASAARDAYPQTPLILTGHLHVAGGAVSEMSERRLMIGGSEATPSSVFPARAIYVALGHLHRPQTLGSAPMLRYAGSPFPMSTAERDYRHSVTQIDIDGQELRMEEIPVPRPVAFLRAPERGALPLQELEATLSALRLAETNQERRAYLEVAVKLDGPEPDLRQKIEAALGDAPVRLTRIVRETKPTSPESAPNEDNQDLDASTPIDIFARKHRDAFGVDPSPDLVAGFVALEAAAQDPMGREDRN
ncbi:MAG: exonuclease SbcCD subunit D C-terminal domain-containing protein [Pseudomonadota bacterium]